MGAAIVAMVVKACQVEPVVITLPVPPSPRPAVAAPRAVAPVAPASSSPGELVPAAAAAGPALVVQNPCSQALRLAINFGHANGQRVSAGFFGVAPRARLTPAIAGGAIVASDMTLYYYTETPQAEPVENGTRHHTVGDRMVGMKSITLDRSGPHVIDLECPGETSGRP